MTLGCLDEGAEQLVTLGRVEDSFGTDGLSLVLGGQQRKKRILYGAVELERLGLKLQLGLLPMRAEGDSRAGFREQERLLCRKVQVKQ